ncbi:3203_t:CDS:2, partial [Cetraspora pellucida]
HNCQINPDQYHGITNNVLKKAKEKGTFDQYNYLEVGKQLCYFHYLSIIDHNNTYKSSANNETDIIELESSMEIDKLDSSTETLLTDDEIKKLSDDELVSLIEKLKKELETFGDKIALMTKVLYEKQRKENQ